MAHALYNVYHPQEQLQLCFEFLWYENVLRQGKSQMQLDKESYTYIFLSNIFESCCIMNDFFYDIDYIYMAENKKSDYLLRSNMIYSLKLVTFTHFLMFECVVLAREF